MVSLVFSFPVGLPSFIQKIRFHFLVLISQQEEENEALRNTLILRRIFKFLPLPTLFQCSEINKFWNFQVRNFIRDFRQCNALINGPFPCQKLQKFHEVLGQINPHANPYTGLVLQLREYNDSKSSCEHCEELENVGNVFENWDPRFLSISWTLYFLPGSCPPVSMIENLVKIKSKNLVGLKLGDLHGDFEIEDDEDLDLNKLKILESGQLGIDESMMKRILEAAPNLTTILSPLNPRNFHQIVPEPNWNLIHAFNLQIETDMDYENCLKFLEIKPQLEKLVVTCGILFFPMEFKMVLNDFLTNSLTTLKMLDLQLCHEVFDFGFNLPPLVNLDKLTFEISDTTVENYLGVLKSINFATIFPALNSVKLILKEDDLPSALAFLPPQSAVIGDPENFSKRASSAKKLEIMAYGVKLSRAEIFVAELKPIFPHLTSLKMEGAVPLREIFNSWTNLTHLDVHLDRQQLSGGDHESIFCGFSRQEVVHLMQNDCKLLETLSLVPSAPCLLTMLRKSASLPKIFFSSEVI